MSQEKIKEKQSALALLSFLALAMAVGGMAYLRYGHQVIQAIYEGRSTPFLNSLIEGQNAFPLRLYLSTADGMFFAFLAVFSITMGLTLLFSFNRPLGVRLQWSIAATLVFLIVSVQWLLPMLGENEAVYLIGPKKWLHPEFLANDWVWQRRQYSHFVFELLASPFYLFLSPLGLALFGRLLVWGLLIGALIRLAKTLGLAGWEFVLAFVFWIYAGQSLAAGEWVFGGVEAKCFSYVFLLMALRSLLNQEVFRSAIYTGLAASLNLVVGEWGILALWMANLARGKREGFFKRVVFFPLLSFLFALPGILPAIYQILRTGKITWEDYGVFMFLRSLHHLDPRNFLSLVQMMEGSSYYVLTLILLWKSFKREHARILTIFLTTLIGFFLFGLAARELSFLPFLLTEPFRLGPLFLLLFFFGGAFRFLGSHFKGKTLFSRGLTVLIMGILVMDFFRYEIPVKFLKHTGSFIALWKDYLVEGSRDDRFLDMAGWIKAHTEKDSIFVAPPWEDRFWILAERAQIVNYKYITRDASMKEWKSRLVELNGGKPFRGKRVLDELKENYSFLTKEQLLQLKAKYHTAYYLTTKERPDLPFLLLYSNNTYYLYDLRTLVPKQVKRMIPTA